MQGIYKVFKRRGELGSTFKFTNNLQVCLALLAFCALIVAEIGRAIWGWWQLSIELSPFQWLIYILLSILVFICFIGGLYALCNSLILFSRAIFGQRCMYNPSLIEDKTILAAMTPIKDGATIEECTSALDILITMRSRTEGRLKAEVEKRILEYQEIIDELRAREGEK